MQHEPVVQRYAGSKAKFCTDIWAPYIYDAVIEPFAGAAHYSLFSINQGAVFSPKALFWADADRSLRAIYGAWLWGDHQAVRDAIAKLQFSFFLNGQDSAWDQLAESFNRLHAKEEVERSRLETIEFAALSLAVRKLTFGGMVRTNGGDGKLNLRYVPVQVTEFMNWAYKLPKRPTQPVSLSARWEDAFNAFKVSQYKSAQCLIDPPYYLPKGKQKLTACYPGHRPHAPETMALCTNAFRAALETPGVDRIIITNYGSDGLDAAISAIAKEYKVGLLTQDTGTLASIQRGKKTTTKASQKIWVANRASVEAIAC